MSVVAGWLGGDVRERTSPPAHPRVVLARPAPRREVAAVRRGVRVPRHRAGAPVPGGLPPRDPRVHPQRRRLADRPRPADRVPRGRAGGHRHRQVRRPCRGHRVALVPGRRRRGAGVRRQNRAGDDRHHAAGRGVRRVLARVAEPDRRRRPHRAEAALLRGQLHAAQPRHRDRRHRRRPLRRRRATGHLPADLPGRRGDASCPSSTCCSFRCATWPDARSTTATTSRRRPSPTSRCCAGRRSRG